MRVYLPATLLLLAAVVVEQAMQGVVARAGI